jgi:hypothetical protein
MTTLGRCSLWVRGFLLCSFTDHPLVLGGQSAAGGQSARGCGPFGGPFRQRQCFSVGGDFCTADHPRPVFRTVRPISVEQSATARRTVWSVRRFLPRLFDSFVSFLVLPRVLCGIVPRTCNWSITMLSWRLVLLCDFWNCDCDIGRVLWGEFLSAPIHSPPISGRLIGPSSGQAWCPDSWSVMTRRPKSSFFRITQYNGDAHNTHAHSPLWIHVHKPYPYENLRMTEHQQIWRFPKSPLVPHRRRECRLPLNV